LQPLSIYIHIPYCEATCIYCDFNTYVGREGQFEAYTVALCQHLALDAPLAAGREVQTVYLGGGTPTILSNEQLGRIMAAVQANYTLAPAAEISIEGNPGTVTVESLRGLREIGFNRLSLGAQTLDDTMLVTLGRHHNAREIGVALEAARTAGFQNVSLDFIFALPGQDAAHWQQTLEGALQLAPDHLSVYSLIVEDGTPLAKFVSEGRLHVPDDDLAGAMYEWTVARLAQAGYQQYEISNWARPPSPAPGLPPSFESRHNKAYWYNDDWLAFGPGAHGHLAGRRYWQVRAPNAYIKRIASRESTVKGTEQLDLLKQAGETMLLGLRLVREGVDVAAFAARYGQPPATLFGPQIEKLLARGLIEYASLPPDAAAAARQVIRLTPPAYVLGNEVFVEFI